MTNTCQENQEKRKEEKIEKNRSLGKRRRGRSRRKPEANSNVSTGMNLKTSAKMQRETIRKHASKMYVIIEMLKSLSLACKFNDKESKKKRKKNSASDEKNQTC